MKTSPDCIPCIQRQVLAAARRTTGDDWLHRKVLKEVMHLLGTDDLSRSPAETLHDALKVARKVLGVVDPLKDARDALGRECVAEAQRVAPTLASAPDPLAQAVKLAGAANIADAAIFGAVDLKATIDRVLAAPLPTDVYEEFKDDLARASRILYILDNAGESLFDWVLLRRLGEGKDMAVAVRKSPVLHDVQREDLEVDARIRIVDPGVDTLGVPLVVCSKEFREEYEKADLIVAKGSANYETLDQEPRPFYALLLPKCEVVARHFGVSVGDLVFQKKD